MSRRRALQILVVDDVAVRQFMESDEYVAPHITIAEVLSSRGRVNAIADIAIVDMAAGSRQDVIVCALLLRNAGRIVLVGRPDRVAREFLDELQEFADDARARRQAIRREVLLTEEAMEVFGDVADVVAYFEKEFLIR